MTDSGPRGQTSGPASEDHQRVDGPIIGPVDAPDLHVMSFNIRRRMPETNPWSPDRWTKRRGLLGRILQAERPTVLGVQEALPDQDAFIRRMLGDDYAALGTGRNADGSGERCTMYYAVDRLELVSSTQFALSETPSIPGSRSWGNMIPRIAVSAHFRDRETGSEFRAINTHFDHISRTARERSAQLLGALAAQSAAVGVPAVVLGDANAGIDTIPYRTLLETGGLVDSWMAAEKRLTPLWGTFSNYRAPTRGGRRIDWIMPDEKGFEVREAAINAARSGGVAASDHEPIHVVLRVRSSVSAALDTSDAEQPGTR